MSGSDNEIVARLERAFKNDIFLSPDFKPENALPIGRPLIHITYEAASELYDMVKSLREQSSPATAPAKQNVPVFKAVQIIPWEPGQLGIAITWPNGQQCAFPAPNLPNCRTKEHVACEAELSALRAVAEAARELIRLHFMDSAGWYRNRPEVAAVHKALSALPPSGDR